MSDQKDGFILEETSQTLREDLIGDLRINCAERIVEEIDVCVGVTSSSERDAGSLSSRDVDSSLSDLSVEAVGELSHIFLELTHSHDLRETFLIKRKSK